ncbi:hypothetical protein ON010_g12836 [Phytophthora cinnamomi]|nr:hypothetical protein ON010_g12836 [Phytophthora cinnamomi]
MTRNQQRLEDVANRQLDKIRPRQGDFVFPTLDEMKQLPQKHQRTESANATSDDDGTMTIGGRIWIPESAKKERQRILIVAHCGS